MEKYRPDTLADVSGHQDIIATINKFVDANVRHHGQDEEISAAADTCIEITASAALWPAWYRKDIDSSSASKEDIRKEEHATNGVGAQRIRRQRYRRSERTDQDLLEHKADLLGVSGGAEGHHEW